MTKSTSASEPSSDETTPPSPTPPQQVGDTPVAPWAMPTPEEKAAVKPVRQALREALDAVDSQEKADTVIEELAAATSDQTVKEVAESAPPLVPATPPTAPGTAPASPAVPTLTEAAEQVKQAGQAADDSEKTKDILAETAHVIATTHGHEREVLAEATQEVLNPQQQGAVDPKQEEQRTYLRQALLKRLKPLDALDANVFLLINHLPHTRLLNRFFYTLTLIFTGGAAWYTFMALVLWRRPQLGWRMVRESAVPLALAVSLVEYPIKRYFRRKRPFITIIQAIVIGKKPGSWSFPSGHSATAFAGAWLLSQHFPRKRGLLYTIASLVAFSRVYLGDHYPGDVVAGSTLGTVFAMIFRRLSRL